MASTPLFLLLFDCSCHILPLAAHAQVGRFSSCCLGGSGRGSGGICSTCSSRQIQHQLLSRWFRGSGGICMATLLHGCTGGTKNNTVTTRGTLIGEQHRGDREFFLHGRLSTVRYGTVRYGTVRYGTVRYGTAL